MNLNFYVYFIGRFVIGGSTELLSTFQNGYSFSAYGKSVLTFFTPWYAFVWVRNEGVKVGGGWVRNVSFSEHFAYVLMNDLQEISSTILQQNFLQSIRYKSQTDLVSGTK